MTKLLLGSPVAEQKKKELLAIKESVFPDDNFYLAIIHLGNNSASEIYVKLKIKYADSLGIRTREIVGTDNTLDDVKNIIKKLNADKYCVGIVIQLPLPSHLSMYKDELCNLIDGDKDVDGLGNGRVLPATVRGIFELLDYYQIGNIGGKDVVVIGQSKLIGKPLAIECMKKGAKVKTFDINDTTENIINTCQNSDIIFSCTGDLNFVKKNFINENKKQIIIDAGYGYIDGKPNGDVKFDEVAPLVSAITPVPGGVGPLTVVSLFANLFEMNMKH